MSKWGHKPEPHTGSWSGETYCEHIPEHLKQYGRSQMCGVPVKQHPDGSWQHAPERAL